MSPHFRHSAAQFSHAFAHSPHIAPDSGASYSIKATHARHVSKHVRQCFSQLGQSQLTRHSRQARWHSPQALMQSSLSTGSSFVSAPAADGETATSVKSSAKHEIMEKINRDISSPHKGKSKERKRFFPHGGRIAEVPSHHATARSPGGIAGDSSPPYAVEDSYGSTRNERTQNGNSHRWCACCVIP